MNHKLVLNLSFSDFFASVRLLSKQNHKMLSKSVQKTARAPLSLQNSSAACVCERSFRVPVLFCSASPAVSAFVLSLLQRRRALHALQHTSLLPEAIKSQALAAAHGPRGLAQSAWNYLEVQFARCNPHCFLARK